MSILTKFFGRTASEGAAFALGTAVGPALSPAVRELVNEAWAHYPTMPLRAQDAALAAAKGVADYIDKQDEASKTGIGPERFAALVDIARSYPQLAQLLELRRRGLIGEADLHTLLRRLGFTDENADRLAALEHVLLSAADLAMMRQQGFIDRDRQVADSARVGVSAEHAELLFEISGLPPGIETALAMLRRGIIDEGEFARIVREGHTKTKYTDELLRLRHPVLSATQAATLRLKGWISADTAAELGALTGYTAEQMERLYLALGRPAAPVQMFTAWARGVDGPAGTPLDREQFLQGIRESDIRPEWGPLLWGIRHAYPSLFQLRRAVQDGSIAPARARTILRYERYEQQDIDGLVASWTSEGDGAQAEPTKAEVVREYESRVLDLATATRLLRQLGVADAEITTLLQLSDYRVVRSSLTAAMTKTRTLYVGWRIERLEASNELDALGIPAAARDLALATWDQERELARPWLTATQVATAAQRDVFTPQEAYGELTGRGYSDRDARALLALHKVTLPA